MDRNRLARLAVELTGDLSKLSTEGYKVEEILQVMAIILKNGIVELSKKIAREFDEDAALRKAVQIEEFIREQDSLTLQPRPGSTFEWVVGLAENVEHALAVFLELKEELERR
ncbi:hypothetical protein [Caldanaerobius polysaccharolyticus]|uniref:hypothetical protein n=1 Tax=Caldanaerobius polysaccharolyticus TaxID=44256 RepID=UPI00047DCBFA|nr:hypothetical protein [Caldanaerobius polysaccharolyticus]